MSAAAAAVGFYPRPPRGDGLWERILDFVERHDPRTGHGASMYALIGLAIGYILGTFV